MTDKTITQRTQRLYARRKAQGLLRLQVWVKPEWVQDIKDYIKELTDNITKKE